jgi:hypothetical protein
VRRLIECRELLREELRQAAAAGEEPPAGFADEVAKLDARLTAMSQPSAEYAAMTRAALG